MIRTLCYYLYLCKYQLNSVKFKSCVMFLEGRVFKKGVGGALKKYLPGEGRLFKGGAYLKKSLPGGALIRGGRLLKGGAYSRKYG